jgi:hypothetical protein
MIGDFLNNSVTELFGIGSVAETLQQAGELVPQVDEVLQNPGDHITDALLGGNPWSLVAGEPEGEK